MAAVACRANMQLLLTSRSEVEALLADELQWVHAVSGRPRPWNPSHRQWQQLRTGAAPSGHPQAPAAAAA